MCVEVPVYYVLRRSHFTRAHARTQTSALCARPQPIGWRSPAIKQRRAQFHTHRVPRFAPHLPRAVPGARAVCTCSAAITAQQQRRSDNGAAIKAHQQRRSNNGVSITAQRQRGNNAAHRQRRSNNGAATTRRQRGTATTAQRQRRSNNGAATTRRIGFRPISISKERHFLETIF